MIITKLVTITSLFITRSLQTKGNMDIRCQFQNLTWCNPSWSFPSSRKETNELLRQCMDLPLPEISTDIDDIIKKSKEFPVPFPIESVRLQKLMERRPIEDLQNNIASTYPLIHERVLLLITNFLIYKREFGSSIEKPFYKDMTVAEFVDRILKKRAVTFLSIRDRYILITGDEGHEGWEAVGTLQQKAPLLLENCLSYDEMKIAAMVYVSGHTEFINNGSRNNMGIIDEDNIERNGVIIGLIGTRLERKNRMEQEDLLIAEDQNLAENGYGGNNHSAKHLWRKIWSEFYQVHSYTYGELTTQVNIQEKSDEQQRYTDRYVKLSNREAIFDNEVFYKRLSIPFDCALLEANERAKVLERKAFLNVIGIGLGVWRVSSHQNDVFIFALLERLQYLMRKERLQHVADVNLAYIQVSDRVKALFPKAADSESVLTETSIFFESKKHPNGGINVTLDNREPSSKLTGPHDGKLLITTYPWDGNAHPGNEFWVGSLKGSGDPAAACSSQVAELHNAHINTGAVSAANLRVAGALGLLPLRQYCGRLLEIFKTGSARWEYEQKKINN